MTSGEVDQGFHAYSENSEDSNISSILQKKVLGFWSPQQAQRVKDYHYAQDTKAEWKQLCNQVADET
jgi:hypothetical protein